MLRAVIDLIQGKVYRNLSKREFNAFADHVAIKRVRFRTRCGIPTYIQSRLTPEPVFEQEPDFAQDLWLFLRRLYKWEEPEPSTEFRRLVDEWANQNQ